jgi:predicted RNA-binding protein (virulence factor B family)
MILGAWNELRLDRFTSVGAYLEDEEGNDVLLPNKYVEPSFHEDDIVRVFIYKDSEDRIIATTLTPYVCVNEFAVLKCVELNQYGAFLEWGVEKHLFVPYREQPKELEEGKFYLIFLYEDQATNRLVGTTRIRRHLESAYGELNNGEKVDVLVCERTDLGVKLIVNHKYQGLIFNSDIRQTIKMGYKLTGFVKNVREDGKVDIVLQEEGYDKIDGLAQDFLKLLKKNEGYIHLTDKSSPEDVLKHTGWSKKVFKQVVGNLYKQRLILIHDNGITLVD